MTTHLSRWINPHWFPTRLEAGPLKKSPPPLSPDCTAAFNPPTSPRNQCSAQKRLSGHFLNRLNARENPSVARTADDGLYLIEVFPALALPALEPCILKRKRKASYNPDKKAKFSRSDWNLVTEAVRRHADTFNLAPLSRWANEKAKLDTPTKSDQDCLDAAICLIIALLWRREKRELMAVIGDGQKWLHGNAGLVRGKENSQNKRQM